jgi:hypothetical protein
MKWLLLLVFIIPVAPATGMAVDKNKFCPLSQERVLVSRWDKDYYGQWIKTQYWICQ